MLLSLFLEFYISVIAFLISRRLIWIKSICFVSLLCFFLSYFLKHVNLYFVYGNYEI